MDKYYLKVNVTRKNGKRYITSCDLYNRNKKIKSYDRDVTREICKLAKEHNIDIVNNKGSYIIDNYEFLNTYVGIPSKKVSHINPYAGLSTAIASMALFTLGLSAVDHKYNPELYGSSIESNMDDLDIVYDDMLTYDTGSDEEVEAYDFGETNADLIYSSTLENSDSPHVIIFSDNDNNIQDSTNETNILSISDIDDSCTYQFESIDNSNEKCVKLIDLIYGDDIKQLSNQYGFSYNFILADICRENGAFSTRYSTIGGVGPMQVEWYVWDGHSLPDIDGTNYTFDCSKLNNISNDFEKMFAVSIYKHIFIDQNISREKLEENINSYLNIVKDDYYENDYNNKIAYFNGYLNIIDNATSFEEAKDQTLSYFDISEENINQYDNAIEGVKAGEVILHDNLNTIYNNNKNNMYGYKLSNYDVGVFAIWAQNKGITCVEECLKVTYNSFDTENAIIRSPGGDNDYLPHVFGFMPSDSVISFKIDNEVINIKPENIALENKITK